MNWVDLVVLAVLALSGLLAFMRGFVREVLGLGAWAIAGFVASPYGLLPKVQPWARQQFADPTTADLVAFGGVFVVTLVILWMVASAVSSAVRSSVLGGLDRTLGFVFGLLRGAVLVSVFYIIAGLGVPVEQWPPVVTEAATLPAVYRGAEIIVSHMPDAYRPTLPPPPSGRPTTSASLLQPKPAGRALGPRLPD